MKCISWNVNGLRACVTKGFQEYFDQMNADFFCLQETKLQEGQITMDLPGYHQFWNYAQKKGYSGTAVFAKEAPLSVTYGVGVEELDTEGRLITLEYPDFYLITCYTPNAQQGLARIDHRLKWDDAFRAHLHRLDQQKPVIACGDLNATHQSSQSIAKPKKPIIICGDFNVAATPLDLKNPKANEGNAGYSPQERESFQKLLQMGCVDTFRHLHPEEEKYSWWSYRFKARERNAGWRIDYFLTYGLEPERIKEADILTDILGSDHCPIVLDIDF